MIESARLGEPAKGAASLLASYGSDALPAIRLAISDRGYPRKRFLLDALAQMNGPSAEGTLAWSLNHGAGALARIACYDLLRDDGRPVPRSASLAAARLLDSPIATNREWAAVVIQASVPSSDLESVLVDHAADPDGYARDAVLTAISAYRDSRASSAMDAAIRKGNVGPLARVALQIARPGTGAASAAAELQRRFLTGNAAERDGCLYVAALSGKPSERRLLGLGLRDADSGVRDSAARYAARFRTGEIPGLASVLQAYKPEEIPPFLLIVAGLSAKGRSALRSLAAAGHGDPQHLVEALGIAPEESTRVVLLRMLRYPGRQWRFAAASGLTAYRHALHQLGGVPLEAAACLRSSDASERFAASAALFRNSDPWAARLRSRGLGDPDPQVRLAFVRGSP